MEKKKKYTHTTVIHVRTFPWLWLADALPQACSGTTQQDLNGTEVNRIKSISAELNWTENAFFVVVVVVGGVAAGTFPSGGRTWREGPPIQIDPPV